MSDKLREYEILFGTTPPRWAWLSTHADLDAEFRQWISDGCKHDSYWTDPDGGGFAWDMVVFLVPKEHGGALYLPRGDA